ncbi:hypothetical protein BS329_03645 [Amycolatopsis coloradensis]|uniref:Uncharacterized protein n=1 Tax=Amycolatopsis coloradensis TaxID=76021 RepID=A0A1R0L086_9PSEU|nr:hypothetical protein [Amycolatopsis coloradensis]OLZ55134.1 hypothetical protein BS329_03645 [Amycolatopsis coloradensis]
MTSMTTVVSRLRPGDFYDSSRAEVFIGTGPEAVLCGYLGSAWPDRVADPATVAALPVGREFLTATTEPDFLIALDNLAEAWTLSGFGLAVSGCDDELGTLDKWWRSDLLVGSSYTFDGGRVLYLPEGRPSIDDAENDWQNITLGRVPSAARAGGASTLAGRACDAVDRARRQDPEFDLRPHDFERDTCRRELVRDVAETFGVVQSAVTVTDDPDRIHGGWRWFRVTITDDGTDYRFTSFSGRGDALRVLGPCPDCGREVPLADVIDLVSLGRVLGARTDGHLVACPPESRYGVGHTSACPRQTGQFTKPTATRERAS